MHRDILSPAAETLSTSGGSSLVSDTLLRCGHPADNDHLVHFYESDGFLLDSLSQFISSGLSNGETALVVATAQHLAQLQAKLAEQDFDVLQLTLLGRYISLDAEKVLADLTSDGALSAARFKESFGNLLAKVTSEQRYLRVFGELVALLWSQGRYAEAIELEELWNGVLQTKQFSLYCAYPLSGFVGPDLSDSLKQICSTHSRIIPGESYVSLRETSDQLHEITVLQQKALTLSHEIAEHQKTEERLRGVQQELERQLAKSEEWLRREQVARAEAETANRMKDEFLATVSHELRTPLNAILGWSHMLNRGRLDPFATEQALESIERNARSQAQLVEDLLDVSRMITGKVQLNLEKVDVVSVVNAAIDSVKLAADSKQIQLQLVLDKRVQSIVGDASRLQQVVWNLVSNAIKFTPARGTVTVQLKQQEAKVELSVVDSGQGMSPGFLKFAFDRFRQADASSSRSHGGLGLGLAIVKHLVELHGGYVSVSSPGVGRGSSFVVSLPVNPFPRWAAFDKTPSPPTPSQTLSLAGVNILVVDDDDDNLQVLSAVLSDRQAYVETANSAQATYDLLDRFNPDVLVLDLEMPEEDGFSLIAQIREREEARGTKKPAIALTGHVRVADRVRALSAGFDMFVPKPVEADELVATIVSLVSSK
jgi:signal transduction histidine kinase/ActR/RegA family two-component response regulator